MITNRKHNWKRYSHRFQVDKQKRRSEKIMRQRRRRGRSNTAEETIKKPYLRTPKCKSQSQKLADLFPGYKQIKSPATLSLLNNEADTLDFLRKLQVCFEEKKKVLVLLDNVTDITTDAILVLLSNMVQFKAAKIGFNGTKPKDQKCAFKLESSGFLKHLFGTPEMKEKDTYSFKKMDNFIYTHGQKTVESSLAEEMVKYASEVVWGEPRRCPGIQTTLVELMHNTFDHAGEYKGEKHWWISVEHDDQAHEVIFSFIDFGVGIFRSLANKKQGEPLFGALDYIIQNFPLVTTEADRLQLILEGKVRLTQFNEYYRGKGLRNIFLKYQRKQISGLSIVSNHASFKALNNDYHSIKNEFIGTFISFKMNKNTYNLQWEI